MRDLISRQAAIDALRVAYWDENIQSAKDDPCIVDAMTDWAIRQIKALPSAQPQLDTCPIYGGMCGYPSNLCYECPRHEGAKERPQWWTEGLQPFAQPQRSKGRWERKESDLSWWYECSECGESPLFDPYEHEVRTPFCPWCGARMEEEEDAAD